MSETSTGRVRLDKWLWAARFYKTRSQSAAAIKAGKVDVDGAPAKPSHQVAVGQRVELRKGPYRFALDVVELSERRGSADDARRLYVETPDSVREREETRARIAADRVVTPIGWGGKGRPTKRQRRELDAFRERARGDDDGD